MSSPASSLLPVLSQLADDVGQMDFQPPVHTTYNSLAYAWAPFERYVRLYARESCQVLMVGMNPGPWGMAQTGIPFGEISFVRDWMGVEGSVSKPPVEHPKRPVQGFACERSEVSGSRLWGWARDRFETADRFFDHFFVHNFCPLVFMEESGRNRTPDKLKAFERKELFPLCEAALRHVVEVLEPRWVVGVGKFAETRAKSALKGLEVEVGRVLHPSPASPKANRGWAGFFEEDLASLGVDWQRFS